MPLTASLLALSLTGCFWIDDSELAAKLGEPDPLVTDSADTGGEDAGQLDLDGDGYTPDGGDCDDGDATAYPGAEETCADTVDKNCDGAVGRVDTDGDGAVACEECDDSNPSIFPGADELCNEVDDDCNGAIDDNPTDPDTFYADADGDGYGNAAYTTTACSAPSGYASNDSDCDDGSETTFPGAPETCNDDDDDCDGAADNDATDAPLWYVDDDGDGYGDAADVVADCDVPADRVADASDCNDSDASVNPGASEYCDGIDEDCDGTADNDAVNASTWYLDDDGDGFGSTTSTTACSAPGDHVASNTDCDDGEAAAYPGAAEVCEDNIDNNCDGGAGACTPSSASLSSAVQWLGGEELSFAGFAIAGVGDVDGDGIDDAVTSAFLSSQRASGGGRIYILPGGTPSSTGLDALNYYDGTTVNENLGYDLDAAGDVDGDGEDDVIIGAPGAGTGSPGGAYLLLGGTTASGTVNDLEAYTHPTPGQYAGWSVAGAGDVNGDGRHDVLVGSPYYDVDDTAVGAAWLMLGSATPGGATSGGTQLVGGSAGEGAGSSLAGAGDADGDGYADFLVGAVANSDAYTSAGAAYLVLGSTTLASGALSAHLQYTGAAAGDNAGWRVGGAGDVNADGYDDFLVGSYLSDGGGADSGAAYLILGSAAPASAGLAAHLRYTGDAAGDEAGQDVSGAGDVNADGYADFLVGAMQDDDACASCGAAYLVLGSATPASDSLGSHVQYTGLGSEQAGRVVGGGVDMDADGYDDVLIGAANNSEGADYGGAAYLMLGTGI